MELVEFLAQTQAQIKEEVGIRLADRGTANPYDESVFTEVVMDHMAEIGMTYDPQVCHYVAKVGNANLKLSGFASSEEGERLDLFVSLYSGVDEITPVSETETKTTAEQCLRFLIKCAEGRLASTMDQSNDAYILALNIQDTYDRLDQINIYVLTDRVAKAKSFKPRDVNGKTIRLEVMDIERLFRHWSEGKPRDELIVNFEEVFGSPLPCVLIPGVENDDYDYALTAIPGEALRFIYEKYGSRLLEANVRSFLSTTGKVNRGIRDTLRDEPERFMAYNNGIVLVADEAGYERTADGSPGISWLKGLQIVNGGQTTASIYFAKKKNGEIQLGSVRVPAKIIIFRTGNPATEEVLISDISRYANSQNSVKISDLSANKPFHIELEKLALTTYCPDGVGRWFYERAAGSYNVMLARDGTTPARLKQLKDAVPTSRRISKTDLAKFINSWDKKPHLVSLGAQKNFERFMDELNSADPAPPLPDVTMFKRVIAQAIVFKAAQKIIRPKFQAFQANITTYLISVLSDRLDDQISFDRVWTQQGISDEFKQLIEDWSTVVSNTLDRSSSGRMVSEWAKKAECWQAVRSADYTMPTNPLPELIQ